MNTNNTWIMIVTAVVMLGVAACQRASEPPYGQGTPQNYAQPQPQPPQPQPQPQPQPEQQPAQPSCPPPVNLGEPGYCTAQCPCDAGQGGCADNSGCKGGLSCEAQLVGGHWQYVCEAPSQLREDWQPCANSVECQSGRCGCSEQLRGSLVCLPSSVQSVSCEQPAKKAAFAACGTHGECQSGRCGCWQGSPSQMVCLSTAISAEQCQLPASLEPLYATCTADHECASGVCGCSQPGQSSMQCLPQGTAKVTCSAKLGDFSPCGADDQCLSGSCGCFIGIDLPICVPALIATIACPQQKSDDWQPCSADSDCKSSKCGCYGSAQQRCLPTAVVEQACATATTSDKVLGTACTVWSECKSSVCGCSDASLKQAVCLASASDVRTCQQDATPPTEDPAQPTQCSQLGTTGDNNQPCPGVAAETWRCVASQSSFPGHNISQVCRDGVWVTYHLDPQGCSACCGSYSAACN